MKSPFRSKHERARELLAELDACQGEIEALTDVRHQRGIEKVAGPLDLETLLHLRTALETARSDMSMVTAIQARDMPAATVSSTHRRFAARDEMAAGIDAEIEKSGGLRGKIGLHRKDLGKETCERALRALNKAAKLTGADPAVLPVADPFTAPSIWAELQNNPADRLEL